MERDLVGCGFFMYVRWGGAFSAIGFCMLCVRSRPRGSAALPVEGGYSFLCVDLDLSNMCVKMAA